VFDVSMAKLLTEYYRTKKSRNFTVAGGHRMDSRRKMLTEMKSLTCIFLKNLLQTGMETDSGTKGNILMTLIIAEAGQIQRLS
jgi:hypothetical protein